MRNFESCLFPVFQELYVCITVHKKYPILLDVAEHLKHFMEALNSDTSPNAIKVAVEKALKESNNCNFCLDCKECSKRFYLAIASQLLDDYQDTNFYKMDKDLKKKYGELSFRKIPKQLKPHIEKHASLFQHYSQLVENHEHDTTIINKLIMLKGMSSSSPYIYNNIYNTNHYTGGGFYININGFGIAVDPGYGFVENMQKCKIGIHNINAVIITHCHIDHTNDMRILDDLNYQFYKGKNIPIIKWVLDETSYNTLYKGFEPKTNKEIVITSENFNKKIYISDSIELTAFHTIHVQDYSKSTQNRKIFNKDTFGFILSCTVNQKCIKIGYTSDTKYYNNLPKNMENCDIIIANISGIYLDDYLLIKPKENHLGYMGCYKLLQELVDKPKIAIISEFWNGTTDMRFDTCCTLENECQNDTRIFPAEIEMHIDITQNHIKCSQCGKYKPLKNTHIIRPFEDFDKIMYVCDDCIY